MYYNATISFFSVVEAHNCIVPTSNDKFCHGLLLGQTFGANRRGKVAKYSISRNKKVINQKIFSVICVSILISCTIVGPVSLPKYSLGYEYEHCAVRALTYSIIIFSVSLKNFPRGILTTIIT